MVSVALTDIMRYFHYNFALVYCLGLISLISTVGGFKERCLLKYSIVFTAMTGVAMGANMIFLGVLADNRVPNYEKWMLQAYFIGLSVLTLWIIQIIRFIATRK